ncbi:MAG: GNAT family N-acetyltransferase [Clostridiales bacterium]|nr:GNAT family N-acetyltransferase [Clostridiales bacterium]
MRYRFPESGDRELLAEYVREHCDGGETEISAGMGLGDLEFGEWFDKVRASALTGDGERGRSLLFLCFCEDRLAGLLCVRYELPQRLSAVYGDIGYGVRPSERKRGFATEMLRYALSVCREKGMERAVVGCYKDNPASAAVIKKNGGVLTAENDNYTKGVISQYYTITL